MPGDGHENVLCCTAQSMAVSNKTSVECSALGAYMWGSPTSATTEVNASFVQCSMGLLRDLIKVNSGCCSTTCVAGASHCKACDANDVVHMPSVKQVCHEGLEYVPQYNYLLESTVSFVSLIILHVHSTVSI